MISNEYKVIDLGFLSKTTRDITQAKDFNSASEMIFNFIDKLIPINMAVIYSINKKEKELEVVSCRGSDVNMLKKRVSFKIGEGAVGWVAREKKALLIDDVLESKKISVRQFYDEDPVIRSFLAVPLIVGNKLVGILSVSCSKPYQYSKNDVEMITIIASQAAGLLELNNEIKEAKGFSNHILENINSGVIVIDNNCRIIVFNKAAEKISGYSSKETIGENILKLPLKKKNSDWHIVKTLQEETVFFEESGYMIRKDGKCVNIKLSTSMLRNSDNTIKGCICIFRDSTEIDRLQQQIIRAEKLAAIGRLTSVITHEIRNPLLPIRTASQHLLVKAHQQGMNEEFINLLSIISEESERLNRFLDQFVNMDKTTMSLKGSASIKNAVDETVLLIQHELKKNEIEYYINYPKEENIYVAYTKDQLKQIFLNLFLNSIHAMNTSNNNKHKEIHIEVAKSNDKVTVEFWDTGCGIMQENLNDIFDPFYTTKDGGTGLGLSTVHNILSNSGGSILADGSREGGGAKFTIIMPLADRRGTL